MLQFYMDQANDLMLEIAKLESKGLHMIFIAAHVNGQSIISLISKATGCGQTFINDHNLIEAFQIHCTNYTQSDNSTTTIEIDVINNKVKQESGNTNVNLNLEKHCGITFPGLDFESDCGKIFEEVVEEELMMPTPSNNADNENVLECYTCGEAFLDFEELINHMNEHNVCDDTHITFDTQQEYANSNESAPIHSLDSVFKSLLSTSTTDLHEELKNNFQPNIVASSETPTQISKLEIIKLPPASDSSLAANRRKRREDLNCVRTSRAGKTVGYECTVCNRVISHRSHFELHMRSHRGERPFECYDCGKKYLAIQHLNRHIQSAHRAERNDNDLKVDGLYFVGDLKPEEEEFFKMEKVFICQECGRQFNRSHNLKVHVLRHEMASKGLKPEMCHLCGKQFRTKHCLKVHHSSHHGEKTIFKCPQCDKNFFNRLSRLHHIDRRHGVMCSFCSVKFGDIDERNRHEKIMHNIRYEYVRKSLSAGKVVSAPEY